MRTTIASIAAAFACLLALATLPGDAGACINDLLPIERPALSAVKMAKKVLAEGNQRKAATLIRGAFSDIAKAQPGSDDTTTSALRVLAVAVARSDGYVSPHAAEQKTTQGENLEWAIGVLRKINEHRKNEPWRQTDLAEAMAKLSQYKAEARAVLERLDARDVLATAEGYATLAKLRNEADDVKGRDAAIARCTKMTLRPGICTSWKA
jgi:predicted Zn-dependent protease